MTDTKYSISVIGYGNVSYRLAIALKKAGHNIDYIFGRNPEHSSKLAYLLNKQELVEIPEFSVTKAAKEITQITNSDIIIIAVSDNAIDEITNQLITQTDINSCPVSVFHCSAATPLSALKMFNNHGVLYPLMTLSKTKPVDFSLVPFFLEYNSDISKDQLINICYSLKSEYRITDSSERLKLHVAAVFVCNFINYLTGLAFDIAKPNHMSLLPLAIETVRKAFLYEHPKLVQTGPAIRKDWETIQKHLDFLEHYPQHKEVYKLLTEFISQTEY